jgi:hypothetical protein
MLSIHKITLTVLVLVVFGAGWLTKTAAQQNASSPVITYFSHEKVDASFVKALSSNSEQKIVGVNAFYTENKEPIQLLQIDDSPAKIQRERLAKGSV